MSWRAGVQILAEEGNFFLHTGTGYHSIGVVHWVILLRVNQPEHEADHVQSKAKRNSASFQAYAAMWLRTSLFWVVTQRESKYFWILEPGGWDR